MKTMIFYLCCFLMLFSCEKIILGSEEEDSPINNFELFWDELDRRSGIIFPKNINWDSVYQVYQPMVTDQTTEEELFNVFSKMIDVFDDEHTSVIVDLNTKSHVSGSKKIGDAKASFSKDLIQTKYLDYVEIIPTSPDFSYGKIKNKDIGYIYIGNCDGNHPGQTIDEILSKIGNHKAIIFDVRNNGGGQDVFATAVTDPFAAETRWVFSVWTRNGREYDDYDNETKFYTTNDGTNQFVTKPVIVLTDAFSVSAAEHITISLKSNPLVTHLGDTTAGAFSSVSNTRFLPNGWMYRYPIQMSKDRNGKILDGIGLIPDIYVKITPADIALNNDLIIEKAIQYLFDVYDIE